MKENGYTSEDEFDPDKVQDEREVHYRAANGTLYLEVHLNAIGRENQQQRLTDSFDDALDHVVTVKYE